MQDTFFFYDLETSGFNPRDARIMQFAGQRTDMNLRPIGKPVNQLIRMSEEILPDPDAVLITGITPQQTIADGVSEAAFLRLFQEEVAVPGTIFVGFNSVRFDDEFMRYLHYRNFYDPYEWQWRDNKSRWDILDVVRMTRALRPDDIVWPVDAMGKPTNRLTELTELNGLEHVKAHDALSDVFATIAVARMIQNKQPKLFDYLLRMRQKSQVAALCESGQPFLYTSGRYSGEWQKTTAVGVVAAHPQRQGVLVFDLRFDPAVFDAMSVEELAEAWRRRGDDEGVRLPVKTLQYNRCPAVAPLGVLDAVGYERLQLQPETLKKHFKQLQQSDLAQKLLKALTILEDKQKTLFASEKYDVDTQLYDGFFESADKTKMSLVRAADAQDLKTLEVQFSDERLRSLLPLYKARNFSQALSDDEREIWERFRERRLLSGKQASRAARYFHRLSELHSKQELNDEQRYLLEELRLYGESILPEGDI